MMNGHYKAWGTMTMAKWFSSIDEIRSRAKTQRREGKQKSPSHSVLGIHGGFKNIFFLGGFASLRELVFFQVYT